MTTRDNSISMMTGMFIRIGAVVAFLYGMSVLAQEMPEAKPVTDRPDPFPAATPDVIQPVGAIKPDEVVSRDNANQQIVGLMTAAKKAVAELRWDDAEATYHQIMQLPVPDVDKRKTMIEMGQMFEQHQAYGKAVLIYDEFLRAVPRRSHQWRDFPARWPRLPRAGRVQDRAQPFLRRPAQQPEHG
ncbi:MAG: hypothetical protein QM796_13020 [Chthoniobacteraceae bacterium]